MNIAKTLILVLLTVVCVDSLASPGPGPKSKPNSKSGRDYTPKQGEVILQFKSNGQLSSVPQEISSLKHISAAMVMDNGFWISRINGTINSWMKVLENLKKFNEGSPRIDYSFNKEEIDSITREYASQLRLFICSLPTILISKQQQAYYTEKVNMLESNTVGVSNNPQYAPKIDSLIKPKFYIIYQFLDKDGKYVVKKQTDLTISFSDSTKSGEDKFPPIYRTKIIDIPDNCREIRYELRVAQNQNNEAVKWIKNKKFPEKFAKVISTISAAFGEEFMDSLNLISKTVIKLQKNPQDSSVNLKAFKSSVDEKSNTTNLILKKINETDAIQKTWLSSWLWLTEGKFMFNPFDPKASIFTVESNKVTAQNKAKVDLFENMINKGAVNLQSLAGLDSTLNQMSAIKAALSADAVSAPNEPMHQDRLLYSGILFVGSSDTGNVYMRHLDVANNYLVMGEGSKKEITEKDRMYILAENKPVPIKLSIALTTSAVADNNSLFTNEIIDSNEFVSTDPLQSEEVDVPDLLKRAKQLIKDVAELRALSPLPALPLFYEPDQSPDFMTLNLEHNYLIDAPATAAYSVKKIAADDTEKEVASGSYRINKLYRFRFKAGVIYSGFKQRNYTQNTETGQFTLDDPDFGIDGTFGIQVYTGKRQDIRSEKYALRPFFYVGLSMKGIAENFYFGPGIEPISGLAIGVNAHFGKRESLTGPFGQPTTIRDKWGLGLGGSILIDAALFLKLFTFGSSNKGLLGF